MDDAPRHSLEARDTTSDPTYAVEHPERRDRIAAALAQPPESQRRAIELTFAEKDLRVIHLKAADTVKGPGIQFFWNEKEHSGGVPRRRPPEPFLKGTVPATY